MNSGGYIAYTVAGFKCLPFGQSIIASALSSNSSKLDIPQSIELRPGRLGYRRSQITFAERTYYTYTCFIGISEPNENRPGSFLAVGLCFESEVNAQRTRLGQGLFALLSELQDHVSDRYRFRGSPGTDVLQDFLIQNEATLDGILELVSPLAKRQQQRADPIVLFLADESVQLSLSFDLACDSSRPSMDFFLFAASAKAEIESARKELRISAWPPKAIDADITSRSIPTFLESSGVPLRTSGSISEAGHDQAQSKISPSDQTTQRLTEELVLQRERLSAFESWVRMWGISTTVGMFIAMLCLLMLVLVWNSLRVNEVIELNKQVTVLKDDLVSLRATGLSSSGRVQPPEPQLARSATATLGFLGKDPASAFPAVVSAPLSIDKLQKKYCKQWQETAASFEKEVKELNVGLDFDLKTKGDLRIKLPSSCKL
jgi:hypothetical protein